VAVVAVRPDLTVISSRLRTISQLSEDCCPPNRYGIVAFPRAEYSGRTRAPSVANGNMKLAIREYSMGMQGYPPNEQFSCFVVPVKVAKIGIPWRRSISRLQILPREQAGGALSR